jgi:hypothetical protein
MFTAGFSGSSLPPTLTDTNDIEPGFSQSYRKMEIPLLARFHLLGREVWVAGSYPAWIVYVNVLTKFTSS